MDYIELVTNVMSLSKSAYDAVSNISENETRATELADRVQSLETPLQTLSEMKSEKMDSIYPALSKLSDALEVVVDEMDGFDSQSRIKKAVLHDDNTSGLFDNLNKKLDQAVIDLQIALQARAALLMDEGMAETTKKAAQQFLDEQEKRIRQEKFECVQCGEDYQESTNGDGHCKFHLTDVSYRHTPTLTCCNVRLDNDVSKEGCQRSRHRSVHHLDYPYHRYIKYGANIFQSKKKTLLTVEQPDYEDNFSKSIEAGLTNDDCLCLRTWVGRCLYAAKLSYDDLMDLSAEDDLLYHSDQTAHHSLHLKCTEGSQYDIWAKLIAQPESNCDGKTNVILELSVQSRSSESPTTKQLPITLLEKGTIQFGDIITISEMDMYGLPKKANHDEDLFFENDEQVTATFPPEIFLPSDKKTRVVKTGMSKGVNMRLAHVKPVETNVNSSGFQHDTFFSHLSLINLNSEAQQGKTTMERLAIINLVKEGTITPNEAIEMISAIDNSAEPETYTILSVAVDFFLDGKWVESSQPATAYLEKDNVKSSSISFPFAIKPKEIVSLGLESLCPAQGKKNCPTSPFFNRAFVARFNPVFIRYSFEFLDGRSMKQLVEFVNPPFHSTIPSWCQDKQLVFKVFAHSLNKWTTNAIGVLLPDKANKEKELFHLRTDNYRIAMTYEYLRKIVYEAIRDNKTEIQLENTGNFTKCIALIDHSRRCVYAFQCLIDTSDSRVSDHWIVPCIEDLVEMYKGLYEDPSGDKVKSSVRKEMEESKKALVASTPDLDLGFDDETAEEKVAPQFEMPLSSQKEKVVNKNEPTQPQKPTSTTADAPVADNVESPSSTPVSSVPAPQPTPQTSQPQPPQQQQQLQKPQALLCNKCSFGTKKCFGCKSSLMMQNGKAVAICRNCSVMHQKKCSQCTSMFGVTPATYCGKCGPQQSKKCFKCSKVVF